MPKVNFFVKEICLEHLTLHEISKKWGNDFGHFSAFFELGTIFGAFFRYLSEKQKKQKSCAWYISIFMHLVKKSERPYLGPQNAFSQNVHFLGPKWISWSWAGKNFKEAKKVVRGSKEFKGGAILFPWS